MDQIYPAAFEIVKRQRNDALDRVAALEADLASARATIGRQSEQIIEMAENLQKLHYSAPSSEHAYYDIRFDKWITRNDLSEKQRADLDAANSSVQ